MDAALQQMAAGQTPLFQAASGFIGTLVAGAVVSLVLGALLRKNRPA